MKHNTKSSITLPAAEIRLVEALKARLGIKTNVEVVRRGLALLRDTTDRQALKEAYRTASRATRRALDADLRELDHLAGEGID